MLDELSRVALNFSQDVVFVLEVPGFGRKLELVLLPEDFGRCCSNLSADTKQMYLQRGLADHHSIGLDGIF